MRTTIGFVSEPKVDWKLSTLMIDGGIRFLNVEAELGRGDNVVTSMTVEAGRQLKDALVSKYAEIDAQADAARFAEEAA